MSFGFLFHHKNFLQPHENFLFVPAIHNEYYFLFDFTISFFTRIIVIVARRPIWIQLISSLPLSSNIALSISASQEKKAIETSVRKTYITIFFISILPKQHRYKYNYHLSQNFLVFTINTKIAAAHTLFVWGLIYNCRSVCIYSRNTAKKAHTPSNPTFKASSQSKVPIINASHPKSINTMTAAMMRIVSFFI